MLKLLPLLSATLLVLTTLGTSACTQSHQDGGGDGGTTDGSAEQLCYANLGAGCCGAQLGITDGGRCPGTAIALPDCRARAPECGDPCNDGAAATPAFSGLVPAGGAEAAGPVPLCYQPLGDGCCDPTPVNTDACFGSCPSGTVMQFECQSFGPDCGCGGDGDSEYLGPPLPPCNVDLGDGCCGGEVERVCGVCPPGSTDGCASFAPACDPCGGGGAGAPEPAPDAGAARRAGAPARCLVDLGGGCCGPPVEEDAVCGACPAGSMWEYQCAGYGEACNSDGCDQNSECRVAAASCCGWCGEATAADVFGIRADRLDTYYDLMCNPPPPCVPCEQVPNHAFAASCVDNRCQALDVRTLDLSVCARDEDCELRARDCCACGTTGWVAIRVGSSGAYESLVCDPGTGCPECAPIGPDLHPYCADDGHCALR